MENWCFLLIYPTDIVLILVLKSIAYGITSINHICRLLEPQIHHPRALKIVIQKGWVEVSFQAFSTLKFRILWSQNYQAYISKLSLNEMVV